MGGLVDELRQIQTDLGMRPYRVWSVLVEWSGGEVGRGDPRVVGEQELLPTPLVDTRPVRFELRSGGRIDRGVITLREISPRYTEDQILAMFHVKPGFQAFIEVKHDARDGERTERRRFAVVGQPWRDAENFQWVVRIGTEQESRSRDGAVNGAHVFPERGQV